MLYVSYMGPRATVVRYACRGTVLDCGEGPCISFGGLRVDAGVGNEVLHAIEGNAIEAALEAAEQMQMQQQELRRSVELEIEQARYEARLAARRYDAVDPDQRLVAAELEARWNVALQKVQGLENKLWAFDDKIQSAPIPDKGSSHELGARPPGYLELAIDGHATEATNYTNPYSGGSRRCRRQHPRDRSTYSLGGWPSF